MKILEYNRNEIIVTEMIKREILIGKGISGTPSRLDKVGMAKNNVTMDADI